MRIADLLSYDRVACDVVVNSKKRVLELTSELLASSSPRLTASEVFARLLGREKLGSTGLGHGVAIPHARLRDGEQALGAFLQLRQGIEFDALDEQPVDLLFALLVPEHAAEEHLETLSRLARMFSDSGFCESLRQVHSPDELLELLARWEEASSVA
jgi:PTS system nitrogen regulatory IIA component